MSQNPTLQAQEEREEKVVQREERETTNFTF
jgi:hypothetical protein